MQAFGVVCDGSAHFTFFSVCAQFRSTPLLLHASLLFFALHCALNSQVCLCILCAYYGGGFRVGSIHVFSLLLVLVNAIVHVHVYLPSGSHSATLNAGCDGLGPIVQFPLFEQYKIRRLYLILLSLIASDTTTYNR